MSEVRAAYTGSEALWGVFWGTSGKTKSFAISRSFFPFVTFMQTTWSRRRERAFAIISRLRFEDTNTVALVSKSSSLTKSFPLDSIFSVTMPMMLSFDFKGAFSATEMGTAFFASILF